MKHLVIVESPSKTKKISKFLGADFEVLSSVGHIRDLPKSKLGVDVANNFLPDYIVDPGKKDVISSLKKAAKDSDIVYLATDPDREGEAIAWHVGTVLNNEHDMKKEKGTGNDPLSDPSRANTPGHNKTNEKEHNLGTNEHNILDKIKNKNGKHPKVYRVTFNSITKEAVIESFKNPRSINYDLVDAQQARRILDRLVGYKVSPVLWTKVRYGLSAGRVQSVAVRFIVERENEIKDFDSKLFYEILGKFFANEDTSKSETKEFQASLTKINTENVYLKKVFKLFAGDYSATYTTIDSKEKLDKLITELKDAHYKVLDLVSKETKKHPGAPFTTSSLQQAASTNLGLQPYKTMQIAQKLYEAGIITYMRTDSTHIVPSAVKEVRGYIKQTLGDKYLSEKEVYYSHKTGAKTQEAHEAVRPTDISLRYTEIPKNFNDQAQKLYNLIWQRTVACQMSAAIFMNSKVVIEGTKNHDKYQFEINGSVMKFDGFTKVYRSKREDVELPNLKVGENLKLIDTESLEKNMSPPPRYNESSLIKELEKNNIGRPSTYASIVSTIQSRGYVKNVARVLHPTDNGIVVNNLLVKHFDQIVDVGFTSTMETGLDDVATGDIKWQKLIGDFYGPFEKLVAKKSKEINKEDIVVLDKTSEKCPECHVGNVIIKLGKFGRFYSCDRFPECKYAKPIEQELVEGEEQIDTSAILDPNRKCPECGGELAIKQSRYGKFIGCNNYPKCKFIEKILNKIGMKCPTCGEKDNGEIISKKTKRGKLFYCCSRYPDCKFASWSKPGTEAYEAELKRIKEQGQDGASSDSKKFKGGRKNASTYAKVENADGTESVKKSFYKKSPKKRKINKAKKK